MGAFALAVEPLICHCCTTVFPTTIIPLLYHYHTTVIPLLYYCFSTIIQLRCRCNTLAVCTTPSWAPSSGSTSSWLLVDPFFRFAFRWRACWYLASNVNPGRESLIHRVNSPHPRSPRQCIYHLPVPFHIIGWRSPQGTESSEGDILGVNTDDNDSEPWVILVITWYCSNVPVLAKRTPVGQAVCCWDLLICCWSVVGRPIRIRWRVSRSVGLLEIFSLVTGTFFPERVLSWLAMDARKSLGETDERWAGPLNHFEAMSRLPQDTRQIQYWLSESCHVGWWNHVKRWSMEGKRLAQSRLISSGGWRTSSSQMKVDNVIAALEVQPDASPTFSQT